MRRVTWGEFLKLNWLKIFVHIVIIFLVMLAGVAMLSHWWPFLIMLIVIPIFYLSMLVSAKEDARMCSCGKPYMAHCPHCGRFCRRCGKELEEDYAKGH